MEHIPISKVCTAAVQVVAEAMNCTANIAKGLRKNYKGPAMTLCSGRLPKLPPPSSATHLAHILHPLSSPSMHDVLHEQQQPGIASRAHNGGILRVEVGIMCPVVIGCYVLAPTATLL
jgi:hypothetical protein